MLIEKRDENVIPFQPSYLEKFKTPVNRGFFFLLILLNMRLFIKNEKSITHNIIIFFYYSKRSC